MDRNTYIKMQADKRIRDITREQAFRNRLAIRQDKNNDTTIRRDIHTIIFDDLKNGKSEKEILEDLSEERFDKYSDFFATWIEDSKKSLDKTKVFGEI